MKKICLIGPESSGKSTLAKQLSDYYQTNLVEEYGREYLTTYGTNYNYEDLVKIAQHQIRLEKKSFASALLNKQHLVVIDTGLVVIKIWFELVFNNCPYFVLDAINDFNYEGYILCKPDLPWIQDGLREYPDAEKRLEVYSYYLDFVSTQYNPWTLISTETPPRFEQANYFVKKYFL